MADSKDLTTLVFLESSASCGSALITVGRSDFYHLRWCNALCLCVAVCVGCEGEM